MALQVLNVDETLMEGIFSLVSAVLLVGNLRFESVDDGEGMRLTKDDKTIAAKIARLLQVCPSLFCRGVAPVPLHFLPPPSPPPLPSEKLKTLSFSLHLFVPRTPSWRRSRLRRC